MASAAVELSPGLRLSREEYRRWVETQPRGRFERIEGVVVAMAPERSNHARIKAMVWLALRQAVAAARLPCEVFPDGMTVEVDDSDFEPDAVVHCGDPVPGDDVAVRNPIIVVEVLSPSTRDNDLTHKLAAYFRVPAIQHYLVFSPDRPHVDHHRRRENGQGIETQTRTDGEIRLDPPGISITMAEIYGR